MDTPIYSDAKISIIDDKFKRCVIEILSQNKVDEINESITVVKHGIYFFPQYKERKYIINGYAEDVFWKIVSRLYVLFHDCGCEMIKRMLEVVYKDGMQVLKPFDVTPGSETHKFEDALLFIDKIENLRHLEQHAMKPDSNADTYRVQKGKKLLTEIIRKNEPYSEHDWESCINWLNKNCTFLCNLLQDRIKFIEENATENQQEQLKGFYYSSLTHYFENNLYNIVLCVLRNSRRNDSNMNVEVIIRIHKTSIIQQSLDLLKKSGFKVDPFKAAVQATDTFMHNNKI